MARSLPGRARMTLRPVGSTGSATQAEVSMPRAVRASSMKRPNRSSPTTPQKATRNPNRAAPQAMMADDEPTVSAAASTNLSA